MDASRLSRFARSERTGGLTARRSRRLMKDWFGVRGCVSLIMIASGTVLIVTRPSSHLSTYRKMLRNQVEATWASGYIVRERIPGGGALSGQPAYFSACPFRLTKSLTFSFFYFSPMSISHETYRGFFFFVVFLLSLGCVCKISRLLPWTFTQPDPQTNR